MVADPQSQSSQIQCRAALEDIAHLTAKICSIWGTAELDTYLSGLFMDARDGARRGLPVPVAEEVLFLAQTNKLIRAMDLARLQAMPLREAYRLVDEGDQARLRVDALDDPSVSRDTITRENRSAAGRDRRSVPRNTPDRRSLPRDSSRQERGMGAFLMLVGKWLFGAIIVFYCVKYGWQFVASLF